jgi:hypothetical protein
MAQTHARASEIADRLAALSRDVLSLVGDVDAFLAWNSAHAIDWGSPQKPEFLADDPDTSGAAEPNLQGFKFSRQQAANAIGSLAALSVAMDSGHRGNLRLVARPGA